MVSGVCNDSLVTALTVIDECEGLCGADHQTISESGCIDDLAAFNESQDTVTMTPAPFDSPGPADPSECREARGNGVVIGKGDCDE